MVVELTSGVPKASPEGMLDMLTVRPVVRVPNDSADGIPVGRTRMTLECVMSAVPNASAEGMPVGPRTVPRVGVPNASAEGIQVVGTGGS